MRDIVLVGGCTTVASLPSLSKPILDLRDVVDRRDTFFELGLDDARKADLLESLKAL